MKYSSSLYKIKNIYFQYSKVRNVLQDIFQIHTNNILPNQLSLIKLNQTKFYLTSSLTKLNFAKTNEIKLNQTKNSQTEH